MKRVAVILGLNPKSPVMKKITCYVCLLAVLASCKKESQPAFKDFRFVDHSTLLPIEGVSVESKSTCVSSTDGTLGTCPAYSWYSAITGPNGLVRFADIEGNSINTKHTLFYDLNQTEDGQVLKGEYQLFRKAGAIVLITYANPDISQITIFADSPDRIEYLKNTGHTLASLSPFYSSLEFPLIQLTGNQASTYVDLLGGIDNDISIYASTFSSGIIIDTVIRVRPLPNQTTTLTVNLQ